MFLRFGLFPIYRIWPKTLGETVEVRGIQVTALDARHCPGAIMLHFHDPRAGSNAPGAQGRRLGPRPATCRGGAQLCGYTALHVGDFRAGPELVSLTCSPTGLCGGKVADPALAALLARHGKDK